MPITPATLAESFVLVSWWKPLLLLVVFVPWAWVVSSIYDKHAAQYFLPRRKWNIAHVLCGFGAVAAAILIGMAMPGSEGGFWAGLGAMIVILVGDLVAYKVASDKDDRVPADRRISFRMAKPDEKAKVAKAAAKLQATVKLAIRGADEKGKYTRTLPAPQAETPEYEVRAAAEAMFINAVKARAAQVDIGPSGKDANYAVWWTIDGVKQSAETLPPPNAARIMDFWKLSAGLDVNDRRRKQTGQIQVEDGLAKTILRVTSMGVQGGMKLSMVLNPEQAVTRKPEDLGLLEAQMKELRELVAEGQGVVLLTSPPDGGRTTALYSVLKLHDAYTSNVQTVELDPQATIEGVRTNKFDPQGEGATTAAPGAPASGGAGGEFSTLVRSILRRDPDVVGVAELPDPQTAKEIARADHDRTRVYLSFKAGDSLTAIQTYVKAVGDGRQAANSLHGVINERLVRKLCTNCRVGYPPSADMLKKLGVPEGRVQTLFKKGGQVLIKNKPEVCPTCNGVGYFGQEGVFEVYSISKEDRELIAQGNFQGLKASLRKKPLPTLQQVAIRKAADGVTSVEEVMRVTAGEGPSGGGTSGGGANPPTSSGGPSPNGAAPAPKPAAT
ncbi:MAG: Flp pilus assembly complex ATPase component TadA [Phycisphaerales bacterium]|nr:Flp pilus assembly complex ATPase component TadA [Phycisphaerales bacterium]